MITYYFIISLTIPVTPRHYRLPLCSPGRRSALRAAALLSRAAALLSRAAALLSHAAALLSHATALLSYLFLLADIPKIPLTSIPTIILIHLTPSISTPTLSPISIPAPAYAAASPVPYSSPPTTTATNITYL